MKGSSTPAFKPHKNKGNEKTEGKTKAAQEQARRDGAQGSTGQRSKHDR